MKKAGLIILMVGLSLSLFAQSGKLSDEKRKEFEAQKIAFFTQEMELTPEEAVVFWPLYNEMQQKMRVENDKIRALTCKKRKDSPGNDGGTSEKESENRFGCGAGGMEYQEGIHG